MKLKRAEYIGRRVRDTSEGGMVKMVARQMDHAMNVTLRPLGVNVEQFNIIMTLSRFSGLSQVRIGKHIDQSSYSVARLLNSMESSGLIERCSNVESRRSLSMRLTSKGKALALKLSEETKKVNNQVLSPLTATERKQFALLLKRLIPTIPNELIDP